MPFCKLSPGITSDNVSRTCPLASMHLPAAKRAEKPSNWIFSAGKGANNAPTAKVADRLLTDTPLMPRDTDPVMPGTNCVLPRDSNISARPINSGENNKRALTSPTGNLPRRRSRMDPSQMMPSTLRAVTPSPATIVRKGINNIAAAATAATEAMTKRRFMGRASATAHQPIRCYLHLGVRRHCAQLHSVLQARSTTPAMQAHVPDQSGS